MRQREERHAAVTDVPRAAIAAIMLAAFTVSIGYGIVLPLLPYLIERLLGEGGKIAGATGLVTGAYSLALFVFAPVWGRLSDRLGRRRVLLIGLFGLGRPCSFLHSSRV